MQARKTIRVLALILTLTLLFTALPVTASAALADYDPAAVSAKGKGENLLSLKYLLPTFP